MKIWKLMMVVMISFLFLNCCPVYKCPEKTIILEGNLMCNGEWRTIFTEIEAGELNNIKKFITKEQWEEMQNQIKLDSQEFKKK